MPKQKILDLLDYLQAENITLIFDESFIDFSEKDKRYTLITNTILTKYKNLKVGKQKCSACEEKREPICYCM